MGRCRWQGQVGDHRTQGNPYNQAEVLDACRWGPAWYSVGFQGGCRVVPVSVPLCPVLSVCLCLSSELHLRLCLYLRLCQPSVCTVYAESEVVFQMLYLPCV